MTEVCPVCTASVPSKAIRCARCDSDLGILSDLDNLAARFYNEGLALVRSGHESEASGRLQAAIGVDQAHAPSWIVLGKLLAQRGEHQEALAAFQKVRAIGGADPSHVAKAATAVARIEEILALKRLNEERLLLDESERERVSRRRSRRMTVAVASASAACAVVLTVFATRLPPSPESGAAAVRLAFDHSRAVKDLHLTAKEAGDMVAIEGEVQGIGARELAESLARNALRGRRLDTSGLLVSDARIAGELNEVLAALPGILGTRVSSASQDLLDGIAAARIKIVSGSGDRVYLAGTAPNLEAKTLITALAAGLAGVRPADNSGIRIDDNYIVYVIRSGDAPESIARRLCGSARRLDAIRTFSRENNETLSLMKAGSVLRIPKRLLTPHSRAAEHKKG
jgi:tetratricopeptide (TPR) repeat protein